MKQAVGNWIFDPREFGDALKKSRLEAGFTSRESLSNAVLACSEEYGGEECTVSADTIRFWETGRTVPSLPNFAAVCRAMYGGDWERHAAEIMRKSKPRGAIFHEMQEMANDLARTIVESAEESSARLQKAYDSLNDVLDESGIDFGNSLELERLNLAEKSSIIALLTDYEMAVSHFNTLLDGFGKVESFKRIIESRDVEHLLEDKRIESVREYFEGNGDVEVF